MNAAGVTPTTAVKGAAAATTKKTMWGTPSASLRRAPTGMSVDMSVGISASIYSEVRGESAQVDAVQRPRPTRPRGRGTALMPMASASKASESQKNWDGPRLYQSAESRIHAEDSAENFCGAEGASSCAPHCTSP